MGRRRARLGVRIWEILGCGDDEDDYGEGRYYDEDGNEIDQSEIAIDDFEEVSDEETEEFTKKVKS